MPVQIQSYQLRKSLNRFVAPLFGSMYFVDVLNGIRQALVRDFIRGLLLFVLRWQDIDLEILFFSNTAV